VKAATVAVIGRPSSGKSTLLNAMCGGKVSIVSPVPQTTRNKVRGIRTEPRGQLVFVDTPGFHLSQKKLNRYMSDLVATALREVDLLLYVADASRGFGKEEQALVEALSGASKPVVVAVNKKDVARGECRARREELARLLPEASFMEISARSGEGVEELLEGLFNLALEGEQMYPPDYYTDQTPEFRIGEIVREKAIGLTREEVPHALYVRMEDLEMRDGGKVLWARGFIFVERESQKGILVGRAGETVKRISREAEKELSELFPYRVRLDLRVKVDKDWRKKDVLLRKLIR
jgi:GTP-binding protein Era